MSIGTPERGKDFARENEFPAENLYADPDNVCYDALQFYAGARRTFFDVSTPFSFKDRFLKDGAKDMQNILKRWKPWLPPKSNQGLLQGGMVCFDGTDAVSFHKDEGTGAHADFDRALGSLGI